MRVSGLNAETQRRRDAEASWGASVAGLKRGGGSWRLLAAGRGGGGLPTSPPAPLHCGVAPRASPTRGGDREGEHGWLSGEHHWRRALSSKLKRAGEGVPCFAFVKKPTEER